MPDFPTVCFIKLELSDRNGGTALKLEHRGIPKDQFENCAQGWKESFDKLSRSVTERVS